MDSAGGYILRLSSDRFTDFQNALSNDNFFPEAVSEFIFKKSHALICFLVNESDEITHISNGHRGVRAGYELRRLNCRNVFKLTKPVSLASIWSQISAQQRHWVKNTLENGGLLPPKSFQEFVDVFLHIAPETGKILEQYSQLRRERLSALSRRERLNLAYQKDTVATAMAIAGLDRDPLQSWSLDKDASPESFLDNLKEVRLREDPMVIHDMQIVPGYEYIRNSSYGAAVFGDGDKRLTVIMANRQPLEKLTGTDLIYYNEAYKAFVMVQYKAMEHENGKAVFRPNSQFEEEVKRMDALRTQILSLNSGIGRDEYRLNADPFYLKFCPRLVFNPDTTDLIRGMYMPLEYWKLCANDEALRGPRDGIALTFANAERYFDNTSFIRLVTQGWIGSSLKDPSIMERAIRTTIESGKAVAIAIDRDDDDGPDGENQFVINPNLDGMGLDIPEQKVQIEEF